MRFQQKKLNEKKNDKTTEMKANSFRNSLKSLRTYWIPENKDRPKNDKIPYANENKKKFFESLRVNANEEVVHRHSFQSFWIIVPKSVWLRFPVDVIEN